MRLLAAVFISLSAAMTARTEIVGNMQNLGAFGGTLSEARGVSADGTVVVGTAQNGDGYYRAFRWTAATGMEELGTLGGNQSYGFDVSADGSVVVGSSEDGAGNIRAFRWTSAGGMQNLGTLAGNSHAWEVSADGTVVAGGSYNSADLGRAFRWTAATGMQNLGTLGGNWSWGCGMSSDGSTVVGYSRNSAGFLKPYRWTESGGMQSIPTLGGYDGRAQNANADGSVIVGWAEPYFSNYPYYAFRWTASGGTQSLGTLGGENSAAWGVSDDGSVVVGWSEISSGSRAFVWTSSDGMESLGTFGGDYSWAGAISADGSTIVGSSTDASGNEYGFRWTADTAGSPQNIQVTDVSETAATILWSTVQPADTLLEYGPTPALGQSIYSSDLITSHEATLGGLVPGDTYYYSITSDTGSGFTYKSDVRSFVTSSPTMDPLTCSYVLSGAVNPDAPPGVPTHFLDVTIENTGSITVYDCELQTVAWGNLITDIPTLPLNVGDLAPGESITLEDVATWRITGILGENVPLPLWLRICYEHDDDPNNPLPDACEYPSWRQQIPE